METQIFYHPESIFSEKLDEALSHRAREKQFLGGFTLEVDGLKYRVRESERSAIVGNSLNTDSRDPMSVEGTVYHHSEICRIWSVERVIDDTEEAITGEYRGWLSFLTGQQVRLWNGWKQSNGKGIDSRRAFLERYN